MPSLTKVEKVGYALGDTASNLYWKVFEFFLLAFYTDVFGLSPAAAGTLFLTARIWDAINDPLMGALADRTRTRWGRYRPWMIWMAIPMGIAGVLMFSTPDLSDQGKVIYAYVTYFLMMMMYTAVNIPYSALMGVMTPSPEERTALSSYRFVGAFAGGVFVQFSTLLLVRSFGGGDVAAGWQWTMALYGVLATILFVLTFFATRERVEPIDEGRLTLKDSVECLLENPPLGAMLILGTVILANLAIRGSTVLYYLRYYVGPNELQFFGIEIGSIEALVTVYLTSGGIANILGVAATPALSKLLSKRKLYIACMSAGTVLTVIYYFLPGSAVTEILCLNLVINLVLGPTAPLMFAMYGDVADFGEWKTGKRTTGLVFSAAMLSLKFGGAVGGYTTGLILSAYGYIANQAQSDTALEGILLSVSLIPAALCVLGVLAMVLYSLDDERMEQIEAELEARRLAPNIASPAA